ncbi:hypothetical protein AV530_009575 [Patagioenas fasciata monilis]|uniref:Uncharacterized protein n=1 Tax=Patagioenas fasciata monilis TaxID=372326 RepID=A0A1V4KS18_PATFA|nr:hypothetical protein AV530_009575 [Patagioenas fasciata monilis]
MVTGTSQKQRRGQIPARGSDAVLCSSPPQQINTRPCAARGSTRWGHRGSGPPGTGTLRVPERRGSATPCRCPQGP